MDGGREGQRERWRKGQRATERQPPLVPLSAIAPRPTFHIRAPAVGEGGGAGERESRGRPARAPGTSCTPHPAGLAVSSGTSWSLPERERGRWGEGGRDSERDGERGCKRDG
jgi:hypothetical protein